MSKRVTYLLGAGASANTIPVVADMHERMKEMSRFFRTIMNRYTTESDPAKIYEFNQDLYFCLGTLSNLNDDIQWLIKEAEDFYTIDTLAKKFYLTNDYESLTRLKRALITYFTIEQIIVLPADDKIEGYNFKKNKIDKRYGSFIAAITSKRYLLSSGNPDSFAAENLNFQLSGDIKILSWNYDIQFELSMKSMLTKRLLHNIKEVFNIFPNEKSKNESHTYKIEQNRFAMVKLNGDAIWDRDLNKNLPYRPTIFDAIPKSDTLEQLMVEYLKAYEIGGLSKNILNGNSAIKSFNFAWEEDENFAGKHPGHGKNIALAEEVAAETEILVVIGYSFPVFNRSIDSRLFKKMGKLEKVYIQDREPEKIRSTMQNAFERLQEKIIVTKLGTKVTAASGDPNMYAKVDKIIFQLETNVNQFVIPYELNQ